MFWENITATKTWLSVPDNLLNDNAQNTLYRGYRLGCQRVGATGLCIWYMSKVRGLRCDFSGFITCCPICYLFVNLLSILWFSFCFLFISPPGVEIWNFEICRGQESNRLNNNQPGSTEDLPAVCVNSTGWHALCPRMAHGQRRIGHIF